MATVSPDWPVCWPGLDGLRWVFSDGHNFNWVLHTGAAHTAAGL